MTSWPPMPRELGQLPTRVAGDLLRKVLYGAQDPNGRVDKGQVEAMLRALRSEADQPAQDEPIWEWPIEAILADARWWDRWLPDLNELLGRKLAARKIPKAVVTRCSIGVATPTFWSSCSQWSPPQ